MSITVISVVAGTAIVCGKPVGSFRLIGNNGGNGRELCASRSGSRCRSNIIGVR